MGTVIQEPGLNSVEGEVRSGFRNVDHGVCTEMEDCVGGGTVFFLPYFCSSTRTVSTYGDMEVRECSHTTMYSVCTEQMGTRPLTCAQWRSVECTPEYMVPRNFCLTE